MLQKKYQCVSEVCRA